MTLLCGKSMKKSVSEKNEKSMTGQKIFTDNKNDNIDNRNRKKNQSVSDCKVRDVDMLPGKQSTRNTVKLGNFSAWNSPERKAPYRVQNFIENASILLEKKKLFKRGGPVSKEIADRNKPLNGDPGRTTCNSKAPSRQREGTFSKTCTNDSILKPDVDDNKNVAESTAAEERDSVEIHFEKNTDSRKVPAQQSSIGREIPKTLPIEKENNNSDRKSSSQLSKEPSKPSRNENITPVKEGEAKLESNKAQIKTRKPSEIPLRKNRTNGKNGVSERKKAPKKSEKVTATENGNTAEKSSNDARDNGPRDDVFQFGTGRTAEEDPDICPVVEFSKSQNTSLINSSYDLREKPSRTITKAKILDLSKVKSSTFTPLTSVNFLRMLETFHQQTVSLKESSFVEKQTSFTKLKPLTSKPSVALPKTRRLKKNLVLCSEGSQLLLRTREECRRKSDQGNPLSQLLNTADDQKSGSMRRAVSDSEQEIKDGGQRPSTKPLTPRDKPPTGRSRTPKNNLTRTDAYKILPRRSSSNLSMEADTKSKPSGSFDFVPRDRQLDLFKMLEHPLDRIGVTDRNDCLDMKAKNRGQKNPLWTSQFRKLDNLGIINRISKKCSQGSYKNWGEDKMERNSNFERSKVEKKIRTKEMFENPNAKPSQVGSEKKFGDEKIKLEMTVNFKGENGGFEGLEERAFLNEMFSDEEIGQGRGYHFVAGMQNVRNPNKDDEDVPEKHSKVYKSNSSVKRKRKYKTLMSRVKMKPKKDEQSDGGSNYPGLLSGGRFNSAASLENKSIDLRENKLRSGLTKVTAIKEAVGVNSNCLSEDVAAAKLKRRNSEPNSFRGFVWKQPEFAMIRGNRDSLSSMTSSLRHMNADDLEDFRVWETSQTKMSSCWEMSLYHYRRPWSVLSCSVFKDNLLLDTPGAILDNLRSGGSLDISGSPVCEKKRVDSPKENSFDVEPSITQKNIDIRNWISTLNFQAPPSVPNDTVIENRFCSSIPAGCGSKPQATPKRRKVVRGLNHTEESLKKKFEDRRERVTNKTGDIMDLIRRKSGGFVAVDRSSQSSSITPYPFLLESYECPSAFQEDNIYAIRDRTFGVRNCSPDPEVFQTKGDSSMSFEAEDEKIIEATLECSRECILDSYEREESASVKEYKSNDTHWRDWTRIFGGNASASNSSVNIWKYLFLLSLGLILYNFWSDRIGYASSEREI